MKTRFRKFTSIAVALVMIASLCLSAPLTVSASTAKVTVNNSGNIYTVDANVGEELAAPERVNGMQFLGWYSNPECTEEYGAVKENETRKAYAKYPSTFIGFESKNNYTSGNDYRPAGVGTIVTDPTNENNKVVKLNAKDLWANFILPQYDDNDSGKYMLVSNHSYTFAFKFMIPGGSSSDKLSIRMNLGDMPEGGSGRTPFGQKDYKQSELTPLTWYTYTVTYNVGDTSAKTSPQLVGCWDGGTNSATDYVYFDDVTITDNTVNGELDVDNTFTSFEGCVVNHDGGFASSTSANISTEQAKSGNSSLKIAPSGVNTYRSYAYNGPSSVLTLDSYTCYTISYWYKVTGREGSYTNIYTTLNGRGNVWDQNVQLNKTSIHSATMNEWHKVEFEVITTDCSTQAYLTFGLQTSAAGDVVYIDDVTVTAGEYIGMHDYYCDFDADFSHYGEPGVTNPWPYYSSNVNFNTDNGILYWPATHTTAPSLSSGQWVQHFAPYDGNSYYEVTPNTPYRVTVRYKQTASSSSATGYFSVGIKEKMPGSGIVRSLAINNMTGSTDWKEYTFDFVSPSDSTLKYLTLTFGTSSGTMEYEVDYIKVTKGPFINNNGEIYKNNTAVGSEIATPNFDADKYNFIGWFSDPECTIPFGVMHENETRTAYARYNKTVITFGEVEFNRKATYRDDSEDYGGFESGIVLDPTDATNKVFKLHSPNIWSNFVIPVYDAKGAACYEMIAGVEYTITADFMLPESITASNLTMRIIGGKTSEGGSRTTVYDSVTYKKYSISELESGKWYTYTTTFTANANVTDYPYPLISFLFDGNGAASTSDFGKAHYLYIDNVTVYNAAQFETVTLNNRGTVSTMETVVGTSLPSINSALDEQVFIGWYADPECSVPFGTVQQNESRTAYAKYDTVKVTFGNDHKQLNSGDAFTVPCYDGVNNALNLKANTTYAMRFIYKPLKDSAEGKFAVLGNELNFNAYTADNATAWTPAAITFTTTDATTLKLSVVSSGNASVLVDDLLIYELDYTPEATVSAGKSTISVTKPVAKNNMQTGTVTVNLAAGEQLKANGINITYELYATAFSDPIVSKVFVPANEDGVSFTYTAPANAKSIAVSAEFTDTANANLEIIAASIRQQSKTYTSGLRFRGRVYKNNNIKEVGFLVAPEALVTEAGFNSLTLDNATACKAWTVKANGIIYDETALYSDYQVIISNIDALLNTKLQCVMFVEYNDGSVAYSAAKAQSYNTVNDTINKVYRGITSYYGDEYEDTRNKLLKTQNDGSFSFLSLTDIHIDYVKTIADGEYWYTTPVGGTLPDRYNIQREIAMVIEMANTTDVDCIVLGGDLVHGTSSHSSSMADLNYLAQVFQKAKVPVTASRGNHDNNDYHGKPCALEYIITDEEWTTTLLTPLAKGVETVHDENDPYSPYYYMDFPEKKTRVIVLDAWNYPLITTDGYHSVYAAELDWQMYGDNAQVEWFAKVALDAELQGWNYVLSTHAPITGNDSGNSSNANLIRNIIRAFNNKTTINVFGTTMDYSGYDGQMPLNISGHTHIHSWRLLDDVLVVVNTSSGRLAYYPDTTIRDTATQKDYHPVRYEGTYSEACFDAVVYDPETDTVQRFNFGNCPDDKFVITENGIEVTVTPHEGPLK